MNNTIKNSRLEHLLQLMIDHSIDIVAINPGPTLTYLTGLQFHLMERPTVLLISREDRPRLILPELEQEKLSSAYFPLDVILYNDDPSTWHQPFDIAFKELNGRKISIGLEPTRIRYLEMSLLQQAAPSATFVSSEPVFGNLRILKSQAEVIEMRHAVVMAQEALKRVLPKIKAGVSEKEIAAELTIELLRAGTDPEIPFSPIVSSGPNSANPHAVPSDRHMEKGDLLVIDWGARCNGYCSDLTRTFAIGKLAPEFELIYKTVRAANAAGRAAARPGLAAGEVDQAARRVINEAGYGRYFTHRTGHGLGLEDHETPYIFSGNQFQLSQGMTYTVEPGIYLPGRGGVRIEDDMLVALDSAESLSDFSRELQVL